MDYGFDDHDLFDDEPSAFARWALPALVISLLAHGLLIYWLSTTPLHLPGPTPTERPPVTFKLERVPIDPKVLAPAPAEKKQAAASPQAVKLPAEKPSLGAMTADAPGRPAAPAIDNPMLAEKPRVEATSYQQAVQDADRGGVKSVAGDLDQVRRDLLADKPGVVGSPLLDLARPAGESGASPATLGPTAGSQTPGFSNLDDLLAQTGPLSKETAPIRMDADVLFTYDSYQLEATALASLEKLGLIIQRNPQLIFAIEGHSDSSGTPAYNLQLSQLRAEAVKAWLVQAMAIAPDRMTTRGFGDTRLLVPATSPFDQQKESTNRRVEIVLRDRETPTP